MKEIAGVIIILKKELSKLILFQAMLVIVRKGVPALPIFKAPSP